ncbi:MAG: Rha family transcriptional regulator [Aliarcobacter sp.]|nr:Rha family transcriptional regulator [Aliarcobacter sp.]
MQTNLPIQINVINNQPVISTLIVAENTEREHRSIRLLIEEHSEDFEEFGRVSFEMMPSETKGGLQNIKYYNLNEQQATLLITYLRNNDKVREFKKNLVKAFFLMKEKLNGQLQTQGIPFNLQDIKRACIEAVKDEFLETKYIIKDELKETRSIIRDVLSNVIAENQNFLDEAKSVVSTKSLTAEQLDILKTRIENKAKELSTSKKIRYEIAIKTIYSDLNSYYGIKSWYHLMQGDYDEALFVINNVSLDRGA